MIMVYTPMGASMIRTQVYLTEKQRAELAAIAKTVGKKQSEIIRDAIDRFIEQEGQAKRRTVLQQAVGIWKDRDDLPDFEATRAGWDRG
jgi:metal-responsive CopG/Arc/MetJ family transcriptional regulator